MRHLLGNVALYTIAAALLAFASAFGWLRSRQVALTDEPTVTSRWEPGPTEAFEWRELGRDAYERNCANCHLADGGGWDQYPPLGATAALFLAPGGREFVRDLHLYGLDGPRWRAPMPAMGHIPDAELAAAMNHVLTSFGNARVLPPGTRLYRPEDVAAGRGRGLEPAEVHARRP